MQLDDLFACCEENENSKLLFSVSSTRVIEVKRKGKRLVCDLGSFKPLILVGLADKLELLTAELFELQESEIISTQGYNFENQFLQPCVEIEFANEELRIDDSLKNILVASFDEFFMRCVSDTHGFHQSRLWQQLSEKQLAVVEKHANEFLMGFGGKTISTPLVLSVLGHKRNLYGSFVHNKTNQEINSASYDMYAYFNGYIITENELQLLLEDGTKLKVYYDNDKHSEAIFVLAPSRHKLTLFRVSDKYDKNKKKTLKLELIGEQFDLSENDLPGTVA